MLYIATMLLLVMCYDIKKVKSLVALWLGLGVANQQKIKAKIVFRQIETEMKKKFVSNVRK